MLKLAAELGISPVQLSRRFSKSIGMTPSSYLSHIRLEKAQSLLIETSLPLEQIAQACGFSNGFYLSRVFTKIMKVSPVRLSENESGVIVMASIFTTIYIGME